ncbi:MAG TPA: ATP-binding protein [Bryobacteraceae bacterium]|nr:ATP-binding protein [Bryobacteraceae bacterium]
MAADFASRATPIEGVRALEILENTSDAVALLDHAWRYLYVNRSAETMARMPRERLLGQVFWDLFPAFDTPPARERLEHTLRDRTATRFEEYYTPFDLWVEVNAYPAPEGIALLLRDVTDQKRAEHGLHKSEERYQRLLAREQEGRKTAELLNSIGPILLAELDPHKLIESVIDVATRATGAEVGCFFRDAGTHHAENLAEVQCAITGARGETFSGIEAENEIFRGTIGASGVTRCGDLSKTAAEPPYFTAASGRVPVRSILAAPIVSRSGEMLGRLFFGHSGKDRFSRRHESIVTGIAAQAAIALDHARLFEQAQWVQTELKRSNEELRRANKDLETFAYSASHDLQEPLRNISLSAQLLDRALQGRDTAKETEPFLEAILNGARRMENLVRDLLAYARATQFNAGPYADVDANATLAAVLLNLKSRIDQTGAQVTSGDLPVISMHQVHLAQLFQNLISNALKYRREEPPRIHLTAARQQGWWVFSVADNGIGIDPRYASQVFGLFKRLHTREEYPGSGIGLAICQRIVEQYGGRIWLERSAPGEGSVFSFSLPER